MKVKLEAGAEIDLLSRSELGEEMDKFQQWLEKRLAQRPMVQTVEASVVLDASGNGSMNLGAPAPGRAWDVRRVNVTPQDATGATMNAVVVIWRGNQAGQPYNYVDRNMDGIVPSVSTWSSREFTLRQDEPLLLTITGGTPNVSLFASGQVLEAPFAEIYGRMLS